MKGMEMAYFLAKTDPETYSVRELARDKRTVWDGVTNAQAVNFIKTMKLGDRVFVYHSGGESAVVGLAEVVSVPKPDAKNPKSWVVGLEFLQNLEPPTSLAEIRASSLFSDWLLIRNSRLSTMAAPDSFVNWMRSRYPKAKL